MKKVQKMAIAFISGLLIFVTMQVQAVAAAEIISSEQSAGACRYNIKPTTKIMVMYTNEADAFYRECQYQYLIGTCLGAESVTNGETKWGEYNSCGIITSAEFQYRPVECQCPQIELR